MQFKIQNYKIVASSIDPYNNNRRKILGMLVSYSMGLDVKVTKPLNEVMNPPMKYVCILRIIKY